MCSLSSQDILLLFSSLVNNEVSTYGSHFTQVHQILSGVKLSSPFSAKSGVNGDHEYQKCDSRYDWKCYHKGQVRSGFSWNAIDDNNVEGEGLIKVQRFKPSEVATYACWTAM